VKLGTLGYQILDPWAASGLSRQTLNYLYHVKDIHRESELRGTDAISLTFPLPMDERGYMPLAKASLWRLCQRQVSVFHLADKLTETLHVIQGQLRTFNLHFRRIPV
jgi:hypothetical protein